MIVFIQVLTLVTAIFAAYGQIVEHPFHHFDDPVYVANNYYVQNGLTGEGLSWAFASLDGANWHPLTWMSHMLDIELFGPKPAGHYLSNVILHIVGSLLLLWLMRLLMKAEWPAFFVALLWAVHPANVECVAWVAERKTLLAMVFMLAGVICYAYHKANRGRIFFLLCIAAQILASMSKPIAVLFPVGLVLVDWLYGFESGPDRQSTRETVAADLRNLVALVRDSLQRLPAKLPFVFIAGYLSVLTFIAQDSGGATNRKYSLVWRIGNAFESFAEYTGKALSMPHSSVLYVLRPLDPVLISIGVTLFAVALLLAIHGLRRSRLLTFGVSWYLLMFLPTIGIVQVGSQRLADRYLGLPLIGLLCVLVWAGFAMAERGRLRALCAFACLGWASVLGLQTRALCLDWSDALKLNINAMKHGGASVSMVMNAGVEQISRRNFPAARRFLSRVQDADNSTINLAIVDLFEKKPEEALARVRPLLGDPKRGAAAAFTAAQAYHQMGRFDEAIRDYRVALNSLPPGRTYLLNIEQLRVGLPQMIEAVEEQARAAKLANQETEPASLPVDTATGDSEASSTACNSTADKTTDQSSAIESRLID